MLQAEGPELTLAAVADHLLGQACPSGLQALQLAQQEQVWFSFWVFNPQFPLPRPLQMIRREPLAFIYEFFRPLPLLPLACRLGFQS